MMETLKMGRLKWHHIINPNEDDFNFLKDNHFHPLDIEDCKSQNQRPKIDIYDNYYFLILHFPNFDKQNLFIKTKEVKIFWGKNYIISIEKSNWVTSRLFAEFKEHDATFDINTSDALLYRILEKLMTEAIYLLLKVGLDLELINRELFGNKQVKIIERISITRRNIILINTILKPQLRVFHKFETGQVKGFADNMEDYWGNILDYYQKMWDMTEDYEDLIEGLSKTFDSMQTNKTNEIMKILTLISSIILPLTFITSLYGMNVRLPLEETPTAFWILLVGMGVLSIAMIIYFKRRKWM
ncbi:MAG: magnesium transporter CorA family protein [Lentimicrobiaceae bacterium]|jgi:magnesium transporter|nr:magnesium transporter CorA family protein [Lentimicrobiaceae bacterium]